MPARVLARHKHPQTLTYVCMKAEGGRRCSLRVLPAEAEHLERAAYRLGRENKQETLAKWVLRVVKAELKGGRGYLTAAQKHALLDAQKRCCATCRQDLRETA